jgi:hypothetical protein
MRFKGGALPPKIKRLSTTILVSNYPSPPDGAAICAHLRTLAADPSVSFTNTAPIPEIGSVSVDVVNPPPADRIRAWSGSEFRARVLWVIPDATANLPLKDTLCPVISAALTGAILDLSALQSRIDMRVDLNILSFTEFLFFLAGCLSREAGRPIRTLDLSRNGLKRHAFAHFERFFLFLPDVMSVVLAGNEFTAFRGFRSRPGLTFEFAAGDEVTDPPALKSSEPVIPEPPGWNDPPGSGGYKRVPRYREPPGWADPYAWAPPEEEEDAPQEAEIVRYGAAYGGPERAGPPGWFDGGPRPRRMRGR